MAVPYVGIRELLALPPGGPVDLAAIDPRSTPGLPRGKAVRRDPKAWARGQITPLGAELASLQEQLFANGKHGDRRRVLLVLQAMDCGGKDGTTKHVARTMNPQGLHIVAFGPPTPEELRHPFLWRIRRALPAPGYVGIFNRSHYEDVLIVRVHDLVPRRTWARRYGQINRFEEGLVAAGVTVVKVMLQISYGEQRRRLASRLTDPTKHWKYDPGDLDERRRWPEYQAAYSDALRRCGTERAPWHVVPADRKWYRNWAVAHLLRESLAALDLRYPEPDFDVAAERRRIAHEPQPPPTCR